MEVYLENYRIASNDYTQHTFWKWNKTSLFDLDRLVNYVLKTICINLATNIKPALIQFHKSLNLPVLSKHLL